MIDRVRTGFDVGAAAAMALLLLVASPSAAQAPAKPGPLTFVKLRSVTARWVARPVRIAGQVEDHGHLELTGVVAETFYGKPDRRTVKVAAANGFAIEGTTVFALIDTGRGVSLWQDTAALGICVHPSEVDDYFESDPNLRRALDEAHARYPCRPVPQLKFTLKSGAKVEAASASMTRRHVVTRSASIAEQSWALFCGRYTAACGNGPLYDVIITLEPGYCIVLVRKRDTTRAMRAYPQGADYRCNPAYRVRRDTIR